MRPMDTSPHDAPIVREFIEGPLPDGVLGALVDEGRRFATFLLDYGNADSLAWRPIVEVHRGFEVGVVLAGEQARSTMNGLVRLTRGQVWLHAMWEPHGARVPRLGTREVVVIFLPEFLGEERVGEVSWLTLFALPPAQRPQAAGERAQAQIAALGEAIAQEVQDQPRGCETAVRLDLLRILLILDRVRHHPDVGLGADSSPLGALPRVVPALQMVQSRLAPRVTLAEAATACGYSVTHFKRVFRQAMGVSFGRFCLRARLSHVANRLLTTELPEDAIAHEMGFADASHLHRSFVKHFGTTPGRYRKQALSLEP